MVQLQNFILQRCHIFKHDRFQKNKHCLFNFYLKLTRDAGPVKGGKTEIAFAEDPTGYKWEII